MVDLVVRYSCLRESNATAAAERDATVVAAVDSDAGTASYTKSLKV
jgi:hypothetical protein